MLEIAHLKSVDEVFIQQVKLPTDDLAHVLQILNSFCDRRRDIVPVFSVHRLESVVKIECEILNFVLGSYIGRSSSTLYILF